MTWCSRLPDQQWPFYTDRGRRLIVSGGNLTPNPFPFREGEAASGRSVSRARDSVCERGVGDTHHSFCSPFPLGKGVRGIGRREGFTPISPSPSEHLARSVAGEVERRDVCDSFRKHHDARVRVQDALRTVSVSAFVILPSPDFSLGNN